MDFLKNLKKIIILCGLLVVFGSIHFANAGKGDNCGSNNTSKSRGDTSNRRSIHNSNNTRKQTMRFTGGIKRDVKRPQARRKPKRRKRIPNADSEVSSSGLVNNGEAAINGEFWGGSQENSNSSPRRVGTQPQEQKTLSEGSNNEEQYRIRDLYGVWRGMKLSINKDGGNEQDSENDNAPQDFVLAYEETTE